MIVHGYQRAMSHHRNLDKLIEETRSSQRNIVFPDTVRNARSVDVFLWRGSPDPTRVQRIAAWMFGLVFIGFGIEFFSFAVEERIKEGFSIGVVVMVAFALSSVLIGIRIFRNGFPRRPDPPQNSN
jgi:hypothetical protein